MLITTHCLECSSSSLDAVSINQSCCYNILIFSIVLSAHHSCEVLSAKIWCELNFGMSKPFRRHFLISIVLVFDKIWGSLFGMVLTKWCWRWRPLEPPSPPPPLSLGLPPVSSWFGQQYATAAVEGSLERRAWGATWRALSTCPPSTNGGRMPQLCPRQRSACSFLARALP